MASHFSGLGHLQNSSDWLQSSGDFCYQPSPVDTSCGDGMGLASLAGDFYREPDNVCRGVTLDFVGDLSCLGTDLDPRDDGYSSKSLWKGSTPIGLAGETPADLLQNACVIFTNLSSPRPLPSDGVGATSITLGRKTTAADACNILYQYVTSQVVSSNVKTNPEKYTIKADISHPEQGECTLKSYLYSGEPAGALVLEFQRRRGDAIAFNRIFRHASAYLNHHIGHQKGPLPEMERDLVAPREGYGQR